MKFSDLKIGKRYCWSPFYDGPKIKNGILEKIENNVAFLRTKDNTLWEIPITKKINGVECFDENSLSKYKKERK